MHLWSKKVLASIPGILVFVAEAIVTLNIEKLAEDHGLDKLWKWLPDGTATTLLNLFTSPYSVGFAIGAFVFGFWDAAVAWWAAWRKQAVTVENLRSKEKVVEDARDRLRLATRDINRLRPQIETAVGEGRLSDDRIAWLLNEWENALLQVDSSAQLAFPNEPTPDVAMRLRYFPSRCPLVGGERFSRDQQRGIRRFWDQSSKFDYVVPDLERRVANELEGVHSALRQNGVAR